MNAIDDHQYKKLKMEHIMTKLAYEYAETANEEILAVDKILTDL